MTPSGAPPLADALRDIASRTQRPGLALLLTDGYDPDGLRAGLAALAGRGHEVVLLHLLTPDELNPTLRGDLRLVDTETGDKREVTVDSAALDAATPDRLGMSCARSPVSTAGATLSAHRRSCGGCCWRTCEAGSLVKIVS